MRTIPDMTKAMNRLADALLVQNDLTIDERQPVDRPTLEDIVESERDWKQKYGLTHKELLDKYRNLEVDEFKELLRIKQNFPESYCMECGAYTDSVEIENPDCPECGTMR